jgi:hypothetical protein
MVFLLCIINEAFNHPNVFGQRGNFDSDLLHA